MSKCEPNRPPPPGENNGLGGRYGSLRGKVTPRNALLPGVELIVDGDEFGQVVDRHSFGVGDGPQRCDVSSTTGGGKDVNGFGGAGDFNHGDGAGAACKIRGNDDGCVNEKSRTQELGQPAFQIEIDFDRGSLRMLQQCFSSGVSGGVRGVGEAPETLPTESWIFSARQSRRLCQSEEFLF